MKSVGTGFLLFFLSWTIAFGDIARFGYNSYPKSPAEVEYIVACLALFSSGLWLMVQGWGRLKAA